MKIRHFFKVIRDALKLDVQDLSYLYTPKNLRYTLLHQVGIPKRGIGIRVGSFLWHLLGSVREFRPFPPISNSDKHQVLFFACTENQKRALSPIIAQVKGACLLGIHGYGEKQIPLVEAYLLAWFFFPLVFFRFLRRRGEEREAFSWAFDAYWLSYGYYIVMRCLLHKMTPKALVVANDHVMWTRTLAQAAHDEQVPTIYIQHASVTERFPPLAFDYALLEGEDALYKYATCGPSQAQVFLVGIPRFDQYANQLNKRRQLKVVGVCTNMQNTAEQVQKLGEQLRLAADVNFVLRPHPGDIRRTLWQETAETYGWGFSDPVIETAFQFLTDVDALIAGESNIHLEAALLNVFPLYYDFAGQQLDWYGFQRQGLVQGFTDPQHLVECLTTLCQHKPNVRSRTKWYCATVDTPYNGRSTELTSQLIMAIAYRQEPDMTFWKNLGQVGGLQAYTPVLKIDEQAFT